ncbi:hypothetical protein [Acinetobacter soli]|uniref:hypothetical protein n=1 Tax=Acinetobacter soli TaxID=487316 RepID=UPI00370DBCF0
MNSIQKALSENFTVNNYALGATSCIQNTVEIVKNKNSIIQSDFIISESNVNDIMSFVSLKLSKEKITFQINEYYRLLANFNLPVFIYILPTHRKQESIEDILFINNIHMENCLRYNFPFVNLDNEINRLSLESLNLLMPHPRHFNEAYLYQMTLKLSDYIKNYYDNFKVRIFNYFNGPEYFFLSAKNFNLDDYVVKKKNSLYSLDLLIVEHENLKIKKEFLGWNILAVNTWCDDYSSVEISSIEGNYKVIKSFKNLYTSIELVDTIEVYNDTIIKLNKENIPPTEPTLLVKYNESVTPELLKIEGFLLMNNFCNPQYPPYNINDLNLLDITSQVYVNWDPYIAASRTLIQLN